MERVVVVGGGISGLAAAWSAWEATGAGPVQVLLLEGETELGGKARTLRRDGWTVELGPTGYLDNEPVLDRLAQRAGLEKLHADEAAARRFLVRKGKLREIRPHPLRFALSGIVSPLGLARIAREPWIAQRVSDEEESIWDFAERRLGRQAAERLIAPMVLGVFAGDARRLSLPAAFPRMAELEAEYGSLFRAMKRLARAKQLSGGPAGPSGVLTSFAAGLEELPRALGERAPFEVRSGAWVEELTIAPDGPTWRLRVRGDAEAISADAVVLAGEAWNAAPLLEGIAPEVATELRALPSPGLAVVALGYGPEALERVPRGFGALISRTEGFRILGVLWDTHLFPGRSPEGHLLVRAMIGGATDPEAAELSEDELVSIACSDLQRLHGLPASPIFQHVVRWPRAIPQYELGHLARVRRIDEHLEALYRRAPGLALAGNHQRGIAFGKASLQGWQAGERAVRHLGRAARSGS